MVNSPEEETKNDSKNSSPNNVQFPKVTSRTTWGGRMIVEQPINSKTRNIGTTDKEVELCLMKYDKNNIPTKAIAPGVIWIIQIVIILLTTPLVDGSFLKFFLIALLFVLFVYIIYSLIRVIWLFLTGKTNLVAEFLNCIDTQTDATQPGSDLSART